MHSFVYEESNMDEATLSGAGGSIKRTNRVSFSGPLQSDKQTNTITKDDELSYVEITLDVRDDALLVESISDKRPNSALASQLSFRLRQVLKRPSKFDEGKSQSGAVHALKGLRFISRSSLGNEGWPEIQRRFTRLAVDGALHRSQFGQCIGMNKESSEFADKLYDALARRRCIASSSLTEAELHQFWEQISDTSFDARLQTFFDMVDKNADGRITEEEVKEIITLSAAANSLSKIQECADEYAALIMEELDPNSHGYIELHNLETLLVQAPSHSASLTGDSRVLSQILSQKLKPTKERNPIKRCSRKMAYFVEDNWKRIWVVALWLSICGGLFTWKFLQYKHKAVFHVMGYCVTTAKGGAETLKFNMALVLLPVCRNTVTWLRTRTRLGGALPFDDNINFHKVIALGIAVGTGLHVGAHLTCDFPRLLHATDAEYEPMRPFFGEERPNNYWWFVKGTEGWTGVAMLVLMAVAFTLAQPWLRRSRLHLPTTLKKLTGFNAFWYSHHLFVLVYCLFIVHGNFLYLTKKWYKKTTWMYLAVPVLLYASERLVRALRSGYKTVRILKVSVYPGNVMSLHMSKPHGFKFTSGQYINVNCAAISPFQWHPFSITSAPGDDYLSIHIRTLGDWTSQLKTIFSKACQSPDCLHHAETEQKQDKLRLPKLLMDGPYGAPAQDYTKYDVVLLIGLGIGATPLISIVKDVLNKSKQQKKERKACACATKRAYMYWVTREQGSFEWFRGAMEEVAEDDSEGVIELHNHCTSVYEQGDARSALIAMLQSIERAKTGLDIVSGTRVRTHFARPDWRRVFKHVAVNHVDRRVGVFYCGPPALVGELRRLAQHFSRKTSTKFDFHKENF